MLDFESFFQGLSDRIWKENGLSDVTYALCRGNAVFRRFFIDFFFHDYDLDVEGLSIERESDDGNGNRPDFRVTDKENGVFYIEVKIWDQNQHFHEYVDSLRTQNELIGKAEISHDEAKRRLGYIAAYDIPESDDNQGCPVRTWERLHRELLRWSFFDDDSIRAYGSYLVRVCGLTSKLDVDLYKYNPCDFLEIRHFMDEVDLAISNHGSELVIPYNGSSRWFCQNVRMGHFFEWKNYAGTGQSAWGWLGGWFGNDTPEVYVWFEDRNGWGRGVCDKFGRPDDESLSIRYDDYDKALFVWMTKEDKDIPSFFKRVLSILKSPCDIRTIPPYPQKDDFKRFDSLLAMRRFPMYVEKHFFGPFGTSGDGIVVETTWREENPYGKCRIHFEVRKPTGKDGSTTSLSGWVGVDFESPPDKPFLGFALGESADAEARKVPLEENNGDMARIARNFRNKLLNELDVGSSVDSMR